MSSISKSLQNFKQNYEKFMGGYGLKMMFMFSHNKRLVNV